MNINLYNVFRRICKLVFPGVASWTYIGPYCSLVSKLLKNNGTLMTVKYLKQMRLHVTRYICGKPLYHNDLFVGVDKEG